MVVDLVLVEGVLIGVEVEETSGMVQQEAMCLEEDIHLRGVADLNIRQRIMILDPNITQVIYERYIFNSNIVGKTIMPISNYRFNLKIFDIFFISVEFLNLISISIFSIIEICTSR